MLVIAGFFEDEFVRPNGEPWITRGFCTEPHIRPLFDTFAYSESPQIASEIQILSDIASGKLIEIEERCDEFGSVHYRSELATLSSLEPRSGNRLSTCTLHPSQLLRFLSQLYRVKTSAEPSFMEVEFISYEPYSEEYPIPMHIRNMPCFRLGDSVTVPVFTDEDKQHVDQAIPHLYATKKIELS